MLPAVEEAEKYSISVDGFRAIVDYVDQSGVMVIVPNEALYIKDMIAPRTSDQRHSQEYGFLETAPGRLPKS